MDFFISTSSSVPIYQQLAQLVRDAIARGTLVPDEKLPSVRQLAEQLVVNPNTIAKAFSLLESEGLLIGRPGLGLFVAQPRMELTKTARNSRIGEQLDQWLADAVNLGMTKDEVLKLIQQHAKKFQWSEK